MVRRAGSCFLEDQFGRALIVALPTRREHKWTGLTESIGRYVLVKMTDDAGNVGWGEAPALKDWGGEFGRYFGESAAIVQLVIARYLAPAAAGIPVGNIGLLHQKMDAAIKGYPYAKAAMDCAAYDLAGRASGLPIYTLLGGAVRDSVPIAHSIGLMEIEAGEREAGQVASEGIKTIKIKVGVEPARDVEMVKRIRAAVGPKVSLCVDANEGYKTPGEAIKTIRKMEAFELIYAEQPVHGIARVAEVARAIDTPVMADESAWNSHDVIEIIERRAARSVRSTPPSRAGFIAPWRSPRCVVRPASSAMSTDLPSWASAVWRTSPSLRPRPPSRCHPCFRCRRQLRHSTGRSAASSIRTTSSRPASICRTELFVCRPDRGLGSMPISPRSNSIA